MEENTETVPEKTSECSGPANGCPSNKVMDFTNKFMAGVFKFGKVFAALFSLLSILVMIGALIYYVFAGPSSVKVPEFEKPTATENNAKDENGKVSNKLFKELRDKYGKKVDELIEICSLDAKDDYNRIIEVLAKFESDDLRSLHIKGAISYVKDFKAYAESQKEKLEPRDYLSSIGTYTELFEKAIETAEASKVESGLKRSTALTVCGSALVGLILFLIIPLLIRIEENTRK